MPPALEKAWHTHGYYGSVSHNVKAVYQRYMGWFDGNPRGCGRIPRRRSASRYVDAMGGIDRVVRLAQAAFDDGDFRWAATLLDHAMFTDEEHAGRPGAVRGHPGAAGLRRRERDVAQLLPVRRHRVARRKLRYTGGAGLVAMLCAADAGADLRHPRHQRQRAAGVGPGPGHRHDVQRRGHQLPIRAAQRCAGAPQGRGRPRHRRRDREAGQQDAAAGAAAGDISSPGLEITGDADALPALLGVLDRPDPAFNIVTP